MNVPRTGALASIERATPGLCKNIPTENCGWFATQIRHAVEDYFEHPRARELVEEIRVFARALRGPPANVLAAFDSLSPVNLEMISLLGDLPDRNQLANPRTRTEAIKKLRSFIVAGAYVARAEDNKTKNPRKRILKGTEPPSQNRKKEKLVGQNQLKHALKHGLPTFRNTGSLRGWRQLTLAQPVTASHGAVTVMARHRSRRWCRLSGKLLT